MEMSVKPLVVILVSKVVLTIANDYCFRGELLPLDRLQRGPSLA